MNNVYSKQIHSEIAFGGMRAACRKSRNLWELRYWRQYLPHQNVVIRCGGRLGAASRGECIRCTPLRMCLR